MLDPNPTTLTIANAGTESNILNLGALASKRLLAILFTAPAVLAETITVLVSADGGTTYGTLKYPGSATDVSIAAGAAVLISELIATHLKLKASIAVTGQKDFKVIGATRSAARG